MDKKIGNYSFTIGVVIAIVLGLATSQLGYAAEWLWSALVVLGIIVGLLNVSTKETKDFVWMTVALVLVAYAGKDQIGSWNSIPLIGTYLKGILSNILAFVIPASIVAILKQVWSLAKGG